MANSNPKYIEETEEDVPRYKFKNFDPSHWNTSELNTFTLTDGASTDLYFR